ncbi:hypothetical protein Btru_017746 [Bulinus truncatus]|nr:hypothetical protein Btru_017746 [Bulinus truncatus]
MVTCDEPPETLVTCDEPPETLVTCDEPPETLVTSDEPPGTLNALMQRMATIVHNNVQVTARQYVIKLMVTALVYLDTRDLHASKISLWKELSIRMFFCFNKTCDSKNGACHVCYPGYQRDFCSDEFQNTACEHGFNFGTGFVSGSVAIILLDGIGLLIYCIRRKQVNRGGKKEDQVYDQTNMATIDLHQYDYFHKQSKGNNYDEIVQNN